MECNKDEAVRAKEIADRKISEKDYAGAKKFALKAQNLYPQLEGISKMLSTIDVYVASENKINGEVDCYGILNVVPGADDETVRKQYRKLALMLHPDKNKCIGAEGAFKLVSEAWSLLSDKAKRLAYNQKKSSRGSYQQKFTTQAPTANGFHNSNNNVASDVRARNNYSRVDPTSFSTPPVKKVDTFWTICEGCKTQYEYLRMYLSQTLLCPNCSTAFMAVEKPPPPNILKSANWSSSQQQHQSSRHHVADKNPFGSGRDSASHHSSNNLNFQWPYSSRMGGANNSTPSSSTTAQAASVVQQAQEKVQREAERAFKKRRADDVRQNGFVGGMENQTAMGTRPPFGRPSESGKSYYETAGIYGYSGFHSKPKSVRELSSLEVRNMLLGKAQISIRMKLKDLTSAARARASEKSREKESTKKKSTASNGHNLKSNGESGVLDNKYQDKKSSPEIYLADSNDEALEPVSINVPDPDFHNFDLDRTESSFKEDQVWAAYDNDDGMPRYYARIHKVISLKPFKMKISWLNSRTNTELGPLDWIGSGFSKTCGDFRPGRHELTETLNAFSHKVSWTKDRGVIHIFPKAGNVWAVYRNWSPDWNENTPDETIHKYDMVEVLDDYNEEQGALVIPLIKDIAFKTVFHKQTDPKEMIRIPREEMFRFSHQVPYHILTGQEAPNAPAGCLELDPAATSLELLQGTTEADEAPSVDNKVEIPNKS